MILHQLRLKEIRKNQRMKVQIKVKKKLLLKLKSQKLQLLKRVVVARKYLKMHQHSDPSLHRTKHRPQRPEEELQETS